MRVVTISIGLGSSLSISFLVVSIKILMMGGSAEGNGRATRVTVKENEVESAPSNRFPVKR